MDLDDADRLRPVLDLGRRDAGLRRAAKAKRSSISRGEAGRRSQGRGGSSEGFTDIGGIGTDIFTVGNNKLVRLSGNTFTPVTDVPPPMGYRMVWVSPTQIWLGARSGSIAHRSR